jgi:hypothetical protein
VQDNLSQTTQKQELELAPSSARQQGSAQTAYQEQKEQQFIITLANSPRSWKSHKRQNIDERSETKQNKG